MPFFACMFGMVLESASSVLYSPRGHVGAFRSKKFQREVAFPKKGASRCTLLQLPRYTIKHSWQQHLDNIRLAALINIALAWHWAHVLPSGVHSGGVGRTYGHNTHAGGSGRVFATQLVRS